MKSKEEIKLEFFKQFGNESFRGYPLEQCHAIWEFFDKHIKCQEDMSDKKYTEEDMLKCWNAACVNSFGFDEESYELNAYSDFMNSLNKQD